MWLLDWLLERTEKVVDWFGAFYDKAKNIIVNIWDWTFELAYNTYIQARDYAKTKFNQAKAIIYAIEQDLRNYFTSVKQNIVNYAKYLSDTVQINLDRAVLFIQDKIETSKQSVIKWSLETFSNVTTWIDNRKQEILTFLNDTFPWLIGVRQSINDLINFFRSGEFYDILVILKDNLKDLLFFLTHPGKFIMTIVDYILDHYIADWLADLLGTEGEPLPKRIKDDILGK